MPIRKKLRIDYSKLDAEMKADNLNKPEIKGKYICEKEEGSSIYSLGGWFRADDHWGD